jgi:indole-3-glycerol phosphate synthase
MGFLDQVVEQKKNLLKRDMAQISEQTLLSTIKNMPPPKDFLAAVTSGKPSIIAEFKRSSPSRGVINMDRDPIEQAQSYKEGGASAISVLTEEKYFRGVPDDLRRIVSADLLPVLRKDFIVHPYQILQARSWGADAVLLIVKLVGKDGLSYLKTVSEQLGLTPLVEVANEQELELAITMGVRLIGINNRDLDSLKVDPTTTPRLLKKMPLEQAVVGESGLKTREEVKNLYQTGVSAVLVGETLMRSKNPAQTVKMLLGE